MIGIIQQVEKIKKCRITHEPLTAALLSLDFFREETNRVDISLPPSYL